jgi:hypothetical protein
VVGYYHGNRFQAGFLYNGGTYTSLNDPSANNSTAAEGINNSDQIVGSYVGQNNNSFGFVFSNNTFTDFNDPMAINFRYFSPSHQ